MTRQTTDARDGPLDEERTLIVIATYNERENLPLLLEMIWEVAPRVEVLVIDDNSPDGTGTWVAEEQSRRPHLHYIGRPGKRGLGSAIARAMRFAIEHQYDWLINMDGDLSHDPHDIPRLIEAGQGRGAASCGEPCDVVVGSRYVPGGGTRGWPRHRRWMSRLVNVYSRLLLRLPLRDCSGGYRLFRVPVLRMIDWDRVKATGYAFHEEFLWHLRRSGARLCEIPIVFVDRQRGRSKINVREAIVALWRIFQLGCREWLSRSR